MELFAKKSAVGQPTEQPTRTVYSCTHHTRRRPGIRSLDWTSQTDVLARERSDRASITLYPGRVAYRKGVANCRSFPLSLLPHLCKSTLQALPALHNQPCSKATHAEAALRAQHQPSSNVTTCDMRA